jgi:hypothetical protein
MEQQNSAVENSEDATTDAVDVVEMNLTTRYWQGLKNTINDSLDTSTEIDPDLEHSATVKTGG